MLHARRAKGWFIYGTAGYGIPFLSTNKFSPFKEIGNKDWFQEPGVLKVKPVYGTFRRWLASKCGLGTHV